MLIDVTAFTDVACLSVQLPHACCRLLLVGTIPEQMFTYSSVEYVAMVRLALLALGLPQLTLAGSNSLAGAPMLAVRAPKDLRLMHASGYCCSRHITACRIRTNSLVPFHHLRQRSHWLLWMLGTIGAWWTRKVRDGTAMCNPFDTWLPLNPAAVLPWHRAALQVTWQTEHCSIVP